MTSKTKLEDLYGECLREAIDREADVQALVDFMSSRRCKEAIEFDAQVTSGRSLVWKPHPEFCDQELSLPADVIPEFYYREYMIKVRKWVENKKRAINRILSHNTDAASGLLKCACGYEVDAYLRRRLISIQPSYAQIVRNDIERFAKELGLSGFPLVRWFQERKLRRRIQKSRVHYSFKADFLYYQELKDVLRSVAK